MKIEDYSKYYIQGSDHYLIPKDVFIELFEEMVNWREESKQLKDNWNKLKEYLNYKSERAVGEDEYVYDEIYNEMQELEQVSGSNE